MTRQPSHLDLFCGPGGFATGFEAAGFKTVAGFDHYSPSLETFGLNHPQASTVLADIRDVSVDDVASVAGTSIDVMSAGVPCEGFSMSNRNRTKFTDERNFLFLEFLRIAEGLRPRVLLVENVANLARHDDGLFAREIEGGMRELGYSTSSKILNAMDFGVPQRRRRIMFVGFLNPLSKFNWPTPSHGQGEGLEPYQTVGDAILGDLPRLASGSSSGKYSGPPKTSYQKLMRGDQEELLNHRAPNHPAETIERIRNTKPGEPMYEKFRQRIRLSKTSPSPTVVSGGIRPQFAYGHPTQARGLSIRERARLMSFPDSYFFTGGLTQGRVQTGDAVPPLLAKAVASSIFKALFDANNSNDVSDLGKTHVGAIEKPVTLF